MPSHYNYYPIWEVIQKGNGPMTDAKEMWDAIKSRFGGNDESKEDAEIHFIAICPTKDANQKVLDHYLSSWSKYSLVMRTKPGVKWLSFVIIYNNLLEVFESDGHKALLHHLLVHRIRIWHFARVCRSRKEIKKAEERCMNTRYKSKDNVRRPGRLTIGLGYGDQVHNGVLNYENEVFQSVFDSRSSDVEDSPVHDRFANVEGMHAVPPPMTGNYMPSGPDREVNDSMFIYGLKQSKTSESDTQTSNFDSCESNSSVATLESVPEPVVVEPKVVSQPKVWSDAPIIEEYKLDSDDEYVIQPSKGKKRPSFAFVNTVKPVKTPRETIKEQNTYSPSPKTNKRDWNGLMSKRLGLRYGFTKKACFVELNKKKGKGTGQGENRPVWNNVQRLNHQNQFVPKAVLTKTGIFPVNTARQNLSSQAATTSTARKVNADRPIVNEIRPRNNFYKSHSLIRRPFNRTTTPKANFSNQKVNTAEVKAVSTVRGIRETVVKPSTCCNWRPKRHYWNKVSKYNSGSSISKNDNPQRALKNKGIVDSGCSRHMTGNKAYLAEYQDYNGGPVAFGGSKGYITGKGNIKTGKLDFKDVCFVKELHHFNLFSMSQMCDNKNKVLFIDTECLVLYSDFKFHGENKVLLRIPRQNNMYSFNLENIVPSGGLACLIAKAIVDESNKWHMRLGHVNLKNINKLVKGNLVRGLPLKIFQNDHTCVACQKGKQYKATYKAKIVSSISQPLQLLHIDLFGPTSVRSINHKTYCLVITDGFSRCDNGSKFKNSDIIELCGSKRIKREYSNAKTPQQNRVDERKNMTLIEAARTMLAYSFLPNTFWAKAVSTACYVLDRANDAAEALRNEFAQEAEDLLLQVGAAKATSTNIFNIVRTPVSTASSSVADFTNLESTVNVSPIPTSRIHSIHPTTQILGDLKSVVQTRSKVNKRSGAHAFVSYIQKKRRNNHKNFQYCLFACFLSQIEPKKISEALQDESWVDAMQEELLQFKIQKVWILVDLPYEKKAVGTKWVYWNKQDERGVVVRNKARIEAIRIFLAFASYMGFIVYQMDVKSAFSYGTTDEEVYVSQPQGFVVPKFPKKVYKVVKALYGLHQAPRAWSWCDEFEALMKSRFQISSMGKLTLFLGLQVKQKEDGIFISQDKYVAEILKKFDFASMKTDSTPIEIQKPLTKDEEAADVDVHLYRSMIGSLMYLTASRPNIMFVVYPCSRFQVTPKTSHLNAVKRIFRYLKDKPKLGLWYLRVSSFNLEAYSDSDYAGVNLDMKSTIGGCHFLSRRLISWQCKKQIIMATSTTEAGYVATANYCGQVLWIQNQMLDYGYNFMNTKVYIDNESTICIIKNPVFHSKTKHIEIRHHFIRDAYEKKLI
ncbi:putative ribonuclease H-like domain-containing protein [Tanacetum coccineum]